MKRVALLCVLALACRRSDKSELEKLPAPAEPPADLRALPPPPPPPSPPPPAPSTHVPVPPPIASFLDAHAADPQPWRITFREDHAKRTVTLAADVSEEIVGRLAEAGTYQDGDIGCVSDDPLHIELQRGDASLSLVFDCGHLYLTPQGHAGPFVILASDFIERIEALRTSSFRARGIH